MLCDLRCTDMQGDPLGGLHVERAKYTRSHPLHDIPSGPESFRPPLRVFIVDDHALFRDALHLVLEMADNIEVVGSAGSAHEATLAIPAVRPDVVLMDVRLGDGNGIDVCRDVLAAEGSVRILMLATIDDPRDMEAAIIAGAAGYMLKQIDSHGLIDAVHRVAAGQWLFGQHPDGRSSGSI